MASSNLYSAASTLCWQSYEFPACARGAPANATAPSPAATSTAFRRADFMLSDCNFIVSSHGPVQLGFGGPPNQTPWSMECCAPLKSFQGRFAPPSACRGSSSRSFRRFSLALRLPPLCRESSPSSHPNTDPASSARAPVTSAKPPSLAPPCPPGKIAAIPVSPSPASPACPYPASLFAARLPVYPQISPAV